MRPGIAHPEIHAVSRIGWLRAAVLGANDGIVSTASLIMGVAAAGTGRGEILLAGLAGLAAGAMSMAAGEYVSVSSQSDTEKADLARETAELADQPEFELQELTGIYMQRGLDRETAETVARKLMAHDALGAHARDELGITDTGTARPLQAALASAATFTAGAVLPLFAVLLAPEAILVPAVAVSTLFLLVLLGWLGARAGRAPPLKPVIRVAFWGSAAMAVTALIGRLAGTVV
jgi:VIT1/CCC1 family predicted Fe2+/Mn2+ transporter